MEVYVMTKSNETAYTDDSWSVIRNEFNEVFVYSNKHDMCVCEMMHAVLPNHILLNADLVAASPNMYKALQGLMSQLAREGGPITLEMIFAKEVLDSLKDLSNK